MLGTQPLTSGVHKLEPYLEVKVMRLTPLLSLVLRRPSPPAPLGCEANRALDGIQLGLMSLRSDGQIICLNRHMLAQVGNPSRDELWQGRHHSEFSAPLLPTLSKLIEDALSSRHNVDRTLTDARGAVLRLRIHHQWNDRVTVLLDEISPVLRAELPTSDMQKRVYQTQRMESLALLAGGIAHDFNNLLLVIRGNAELASESLPPDHFIQDLLQDIRAAGDRATDLTREMLAYSGHGIISREPVDLAYLIHNAVESVEPLGKDLHISLNLSPKLGPIEGDPRQLHHALVQVLQNAIEAAGAYGQVEVAARNVRLLPKQLQRLGIEQSFSDSLFTLIEVSDNGSGIPESIQDRIFDPFYSEKSPGRGLGLPACLGIIRSHGGGMGVISKLHQGTTMQLFLQSSEHAAPREMPSKPLSIRNCVLVVDDEPLVRRVAARGLKNAGYEVVEAENGEQAIRAFFEQQKTISAVLMDVVMPVMDGKTAAKRILEGARIPVILSSGFTPDPLDTHEAPFVSFLQKPYDSRTLIEAVSDAIAKSYDAV